MLKQRRDKMIELSSRLDGTLFKLYELEKRLSRLGITLEKWDYDHGSFDYKMNDEVGYQFYVSRLQLRMENWILKEQPYRLVRHFYFHISIKLA